MDSNTIEKPLILPDHVPVNNSEPALVKPHSEIVNITFSSQITTPSSIIFDQDPNNFRKLDGEINTTIIIDTAETTTINMDDVEVVNSTVKIEEIEMTTESYDQSLGRSYDEIMINFTSNADDTIINKEMTEDFATTTLAINSKTDNPDIASSTESSNPKIMAMGRSEDDEVSTNSPTTTISLPFVLNETEKINNFMTTPADTDFDSMISITTIRP